MIWTTLNHFKVDRYFTVISKILYVMRDGRGESHVLKMLNFYDRRCVLKFVCVAVLHTLENIYSTKKIGVHYSWYLQYIWGYDWWDFSSYPSRRPQHSKKSLRQLRTFASFHPSVTFIRMYTLYFLFSGLRILHWFIIYSLWLFKSVLEKESSLANFPFYYFYDVLYSGRPISLQMMLLRQLVKHM